MMTKIHENKSFVALQMWNLGKAADPFNLKEEGQDYVAPSASYTGDEYEEKAKNAKNPLRSSTIKEVKDIIHEKYVMAGENAMRAGFDVLELHGAHEYFLVQFTQSSSNQRDDRYGGSTENKAKFILELIDVLSEKFGHKKIALRLSPWDKFEGMKAEEDLIHPIVTFGYLLSELQRRADEGKEIAYISLVEPRV